jgi:signal transduction histidine kinase
MKYLYRLSAAIIREKDFYKKFTILLTCLLCLAAAYYVNLYLEEEIVYTHFFYIPIIMTAVWYGAKALYLSLAMGIFHISICYSAFGIITWSSVQRAVFFVIIAFIVYLLTNFRFGQLNDNRVSVRDNREQNQDYRSQQINMVGQIGAAVGHEIRNPLTTVRGFLQMLGDEQKYGGAQEYFSLMIEEIDKADAAISHLIKLADNKANYQEMQSLSNIVYECLSDYQQNHKLSHIMFETYLPEVPDLLLDKCEIRELITNLLNNAVEAMPYGGTIVVSTGKSDEEVLLTIQDQGTGLSRDIATQIGTPFFTTKENSKGLGLAICYSIARRHSARIEFISTPNGTMFIVHFPGSTAYKQDEYVS